MARKKLTGAALAQSRVRSHGADGATIYSLPVNPGFDEPNSVDRARGVEYPGARENVQAEQGMTRRVLGAMQPANLQRWIGGLVRRRGGAPEAARTLLGMDTPNYSKSQYRAMLRKVEEWQQGKYKKAARGNAVRVGLLRMREASHLVAGVRGNWQIDEQEKYRVFNSDPRETHHREAIIDALRLDGAGFIEAVIMVANEYTRPYQAILLQTHELRLEVG